MPSIRKLIAMASVVAGLGVVIAFWLGSAAASAEGSHRTQTKSTPVQVADKLEPDAATPTAACTAARQALAKAVSGDSSEDVPEKAAVKAGTQKAADGKSEDQKENAALKALRDAARTACKGQPPSPPTAACVSARQALTTAQTADKKTEDAGEKTSSVERSASDKIEDQREATTLKPTQAAVRAACGHTGD
jgi:hypothetical protein